MNIALITEINNCLNLAAKRQIGLLKLASFLETYVPPSSNSSSKDSKIYDQNVVFWMNTLLHILENHPVSLHAKIAYYCLYLLVQNSKSLGGDVSRTISTTFMDKFIQLIVNCTPSLAKQALTCLDELITCYKASCSQFKQRIESFVLSKLDCDNSEVAQLACLCYAKLPFLQKAATADQNSDIWYFYFKNLLQNASQIFGELAEDFLSNTSSSSNSNLAYGATMDKNLTKQMTTLFLKLNKDSTSYDAAYIQKQAKRFRTCCVAMSQCFAPLNNEQVVLKIRIKELLEFFEFVFLNLDVKKLILNSHSDSTRIIYNILPILFNSALRLLTSLFKSLNSDLIVYSESINKLLSQFFSNILNNESLSFLNLNECMPYYYDCVSQWLEEVGSKCDFYTHSQSVIDRLLTTIKPSQKVVLSLDNSKKSGGVASHQSIMKENAMTVLNSSQLQSQKRAMISAHKCLKNCIKFMNDEFSYQDIEKIQQSLVDILLSVQNNVASRKPYDQAQCRLCLYESLNELCTSSRNEKLFPPLALAIKMFTCGLDDDSSDIRQYSQHCLNSLRAWAMPIVPFFKREYTITTTTATPSEDLPSPSQQAEQQSQQLKKQHLLNQYLQRPSPAFATSFSQQQKQMNGPLSTLATAAEPSLAMTKQHMVVKQSQQQSQPEASVIIDDDDEEEEEQQQAKVIPPTNGKKAAASEEEEENDEEYEDEDEMEYDDEEDEDDDDEEEEEQEQDEKEMLSDEFDEEEDLDEENELDEVDNLVPSPPPLPPTKKDEQPQLNKSLSNKTKEEVTSDGEEDEKKSGSLSITPSRSRSSRSSSTSPAVTLQNGDATPAATASASAATVSSQASANIEHFSTPATSVKRKRSDEHEQVNGDNGLHDESAVVVTTTPSSQEDIAGGDVLPKKLMKTGDENDEAVVATTTAAQMVKNAEALENSLMTTPKATNGGQTAQHLVDYDDEEAAPVNGEKEQQQHDEKENSGIVNGLGGNKDAIQEIKKTTPTKDLTSTKDIVLSKSEEKELDNMP